MYIGDICAPNGVGLFRIELLVKQVFKAIIEVWVGSSFYIGLNIMGFNFHFSHVVANSFFGNLDSSLLELFCNFGSAENLLQF